MWSGLGRRAAGAPAFDGRRIALAAVMALALAAGGCAGAVQGNGPVMASAVSERGGGSIAFESIDGPPPGVFQNLVVSLASAAEARQVRVVSRAGQPAYRVRGYLAAIVEKGRTHISWVWDIYDSDKRRVFRIAGEEASGRSAKDAWAVADDQMLARIAQASMEKLAVFLAAPPPPPPAPAQPGGPAIAADDTGGAALALVPPLP
jgi:hypothetical protein